MSEENREKSPTCVCCKRETSCGSYIEFIDKETVLNQWVCCKCNHLNEEKK